MNRNHCRKVRNALVVVVSVFLPILAASAAQEPRVVAGVAQVRSSDDAVKKDVEGTLGADRSLDDSRITVRSVHGGVVLLSGTVASSHDLVRALRITADRPDVRGVFSEIQAQGRIATPPGKRDVRVPIAAASPIRHAPVVNPDDVIRRDVIRALDDLDHPEDVDIRVRVKGGVVWLTGTVATWEGNSSRLHATRSVTGVRSIINELRVVALHADAQ